MVTVRSWHKFAPELFGFPPFFLFAQRQCGTKSSRLMEKRANNQGERGGACVTTIIVTSSSLFFLQL